MDLLFNIFVALVGVYLIAAAIYIIAAIFCWKI